MSIDAANLIVPAFIAGIFTFLAPCTLPLVPGYLGFISGASIEDLKEPEKARAARWKIFMNGVFYVIGFSVIFIVFGTLAGFIGQTVLAPYRIWLTRIGGVFVIVFGLMMLNVFKLPFFNAVTNLKLPSVFKRGGPLSSFTLGAAFAFGWTPCVGPILASVLFLASTSTTALQGAFLLLIFSLGLAIPFLAVAVGIGSAARYINRISRYLNVVSIIGGVLLIFIGMLLITDKFILLISYGYRALRFINYESIYRFL